MTKEQPVTIVMIEDDEGHARLIEKNIRRAGISNAIHHFVDGTSALSYLYSDPAGPAHGGPALVLLDLNLPDIYGEDVCQRIRENPLTENLPVLILTGKASGGLSARCLNGGADDYLSKPFDIEELKLRVQGAIKRSERENRRERILLVASRLFNAKGIDTTSLDEIASDLGTNKKALYRYVGDKQALISACYERAFKIAFFISDETGRLGLSAADEMDLQQRTHALAQQNPDICPLRHLSGLDALSPQARSSVLDAAGRFTAISRARATAAQREGDMRGMDVEAFLLLGTGPSAWLGKPLRDHDVSQRAQTAESVADFVKLGLAPLPGGVGQS